ncbi:hypothetical protein, partial [Streptomyces plicatus]|uniref:hypothetical protein n=1 Tax=Streptomyces plicatus TaxID=1922 RepID=UPI001C704139
MGSTLLRAPKLQTFETSKSPQNQEGLNITASSNFPILQRFPGMLSHHASQFNLQKMHAWATKRKIRKL